MNMGTAFTKKCSGRIAICLCAGSVGCLSVLLCPLFLLILLCKAPSPIYAYFEDPPMSFSQLVFAGAHSKVNPALFRGTSLDIAYHKPYMGVDEDFSSYHLSASHDWRKFTLAFSMSDFSFDSVYNEHIDRLSFGMKINTNWQAGLALKQFAVKFSPDSYSSGDPYLSSTDASAMDADLGFVRNTSKGDVFFSVSNLLGSGIGLASSAPLNRALAAGWSMPFGVFNRRHLFFSELAVNDSDNFESFDYRFALESNLSPHMAFRLAFDQYYFVPSAEFTYPIEGKCDLAAGFAYRYPYNTNSFFTQFTTLITVKRKLSREDDEYMEAKLLEKTKLRKEIAEKKYEEKIQREKMRQAIKKLVDKMEKEFKDKEYQKSGTTAMQIIEIEPHNKNAIKMLQKITKAKDKELRETEKRERSSTDTERKKINMAVSDFEARSPISQSEAAFITDFFRSELIETNAMKVLNRGNMEKIFAEQGFQQSGCTTADCAVQMGEILNVRLMVIGSCGKLQNKYVVTIQVVDIENSEIVYSAYDSIENSDLLGSLCEGMVQKMIEKDMPRIMKGNYFNDAVEFYEKGEYKKAIEQWEKVLELDPEHSESKRLIRQAEEKLNEK